MASLYLNLIPPSYKDRFRMQRLFAQLKHLIVLVTLYLIGLAIVLLFARLTLERRFEQVVNQTTLVTQQNRAVEAEIARVNKQIDNALAVRNFTRRWPEFLLSFMDSVPAEVTLTDVQFTADGRSVVSGRAATRESLLAFRDALELDTQLTDVVLPITSLLERRNAQFTMTFTIIPEVFTPQTMSPDEAS